MSVPTLDDWIVAQEKLTNWELEVNLPYLAIREKQATGEWDTWAEKHKG